MAIATGRRVQNLRELRDAVQTIHPGSIYYHFWGGLLRPRFDDPEYHNDFAAWAWRGLHDRRLAERLGVIDPTAFRNLEDLRREFIAVLEDRLDESEMVPWARADEQFHFIRSQIVVFDTHRRIHTPRELPDVMPQLSVGSLFYHVIDARRRPTLGIDDFCAWLGQFDSQYADLIEELAAIDLYFCSLSELRQQFATAIQDYFTSTER